MEHFLTDMIKFNKMQLVIVKVVLGGKLMRKFVAAVLSLFVMTFATVCFAETYEMTYEARNFTEGLKNDQALSETFTTPYGMLKIQARKLLQSKSENRLHFIVWLDDKRIDDAHFPKVENGYTFRVFKNTSNGELFYSLESIDRACLYGYSPVNKKLEIYVDSQNYAHEEGAYPYIVALKNGDLVLAFEKANKSKRYRFNWDAKKNWFGYSDLGKDWPSISRDKQ